MRPLAKTASFSLVLLLLGTACSERRSSKVMVPFETTQSNIASLYLYGDGDVWVLAVPEELSGNVDLNRDGDTEDAIVHIYDTRTEEMVSLGLAAAGYPIPNCPTCLVPAPGDEPNRERADLVPPPIPKVNNGLVAILIGEAKQGADLNGDGDQLDQVLHLYRSDTRQIRNLELAVEGYGDVGVVLSDDVLLFGVSELGQNEDLNGDGLLSGAALFQLDLRSDRLRNLGVLGTPLGEIVDGKVGVQVRESVLAGDLNLDGDEADYVFHEFDTRTRTFRNSGLSATGSVPIQVEGIWFLAVSELNNGTTDLNGNLSLSDFVHFSFDPATGVTQNLGASFSLRGYAVASDTAAALSADEAIMGSDLNGDGDSNDLVAYLHTPSTGVTLNTGVAAEASGVEALDGGFALLVNELDQGSDLNFDGDSEDLVLHYADALTSTVDNVAIQAYNPHGIGSRLVFVHDEDELGLDKNGDGDAEDPILLLLDVTTRTISNTGWNGFFVSDVDGDKIVFTTYEMFQSFDLNADGDEEDSALVRLDLETGETQVIPAAIGFPRFAATGLVVGLTAEAPLGVDLNEDGDTLDFVFQSYGFGGVLPVAE